MDFGEYGQWRTIAFHHVQIIEAGANAGVAGAGYGAVVKKPWPYYPAKANEVIFALFYFGCDGRGVPADGRYKLIRTYPPVKSGWFDGRSLEMMAAGCCPPQILIEMLGAEETPD